MNSRVTASIGAKTQNGCGKFSQNPIFTVSPAYHFLPIQVIKKANQRYMAGLIFVICHY
jgi:hypothetical protein